MKFRDIPTNVACRDFVEIVSMFDISGIFSSEIINLANNYDFSFRFKNRGVNGYFICRDFILMLSFEPFYAFQANLNV